MSSLDVMMPSMGGWTVFKALRQAPEVADIPVAMLTQPGEKSLGFSLGADDGVLKPIDGDTVGAAIERYGEPNANVTRL